MKNFSLKEWLTLMPYQPVLSPMWSRWHFLREYWGVSEVEGLTGICPFLLDFQCIEHYCILYTQLSRLMDYIFYLKK